jgi:hypothetical protein
MKEKVESLLGAGIDFRQFMAYWTNQAGAGAEKMQEIAKAADEEALRPDNSVYQDAFNDFFKRYPDGVNAIIEAITQLTTDQNAMRQQSVEQSADDLNLTAEKTDISGEMAKKYANLILCLMKGHHANNNINLTNSDLMFPYTLDKLDNLDTAKSDLGDIDPKQLIDYLSEIKRAAAAAHQADTAVREAAAAARQAAIAAREAAAVAHQAAIAAAAANKAAEDITKKGLKDEIACLLFVDPMQDKSLVSQLTKSFDSRMDNDAYDVLTWVNELIPNKKSKESLALKYIFLQTYYEMMNASKSIKKEEIEHFYDKYGSNIDGMGRGLYQYKNNAFLKKTTENRSVDLFVRLMADRQARGKLGLAHINRGALLSSVSNRSSRYDRRETTVKQLGIIFEYAGLDAGLALDRVGPELQRAVMDSKNKVNFILRTILDNEDGPFLPPPVSPLILEEIRAYQQIINDEINSYNQVNHGMPVQVVEPMVEPSATAVNLFYKARDIDTYDTILPAVLDCLRTDGQKSAAQNIFMDQYDKCGGFKKIDAEFKHDILEGQFPIDSNALKEMPLLSLFVKLNAVRQAGVKDFTRGELLSAAGISTPLFRDATVKTLGEIFTKAQVALTKAQARFRNELTAEDGNNLLNMKDVLVALKEKTKSDVVKDIHSEALCLIDEIDEIDLSLQLGSGNPPSFRTGKTGLQ